MSRSLDLMRGGHYRFAYLNTPEELLIGVFHSVDLNGRFSLDLYEEVETTISVTNLQNAFISLLGLPEIRRSVVHFTTKTVISSEIKIVARLYIAKSLLFNDRILRWRFGMANLYRIADDEEDLYNSFCGFNYDDQEENSKYINSEHQYLTFRMAIVQVVVIAIILIKSYYYICEL